jgi:integrase
MAHVEKRGPRKYRARYRGPDGKERSKTFTTERDARLWLTDVEASKASGGWVDPARGRKMFDAWFAEWLEMQVLRPATHDLYAYLGRSYLSPTFGRVELAKITSGDVRRWHARLSAGPLATSTVAKIYKLLARTMRVAVDDGLIAKSPCKLKGASAERSPEMKHASVEEVHRIVECINPSYRALVLVAAFGGLRFGEATGLRRRNVDLLHGKIAVVEQMSEVNGHLAPAAPKTEAGNRKIALPAFVVAELESHLERFAEPGIEGLVFPAPSGGPMRRSNFRRRVWLPALKRAEIEHLRFHDLRHTAGTLAAHTGATTKEIMRRLGHASPAASMTYQHATAERDAEIAAKLEQLAAWPRPEEDDAAPANVVPMR